VNTQCRLNASKTKGKGQRGDAKPTVKTERIVRLRSVEGKDQLTIAVADKSAKPRKEAQSQIKKPDQTENAEKKPLEETYDLMIEALALFGIKTAKSDRKGNTLAIWERKAEKCGWIKFMKYKLAAFFSSHMNQPLPSCPFEGEDNPKIIIGGAIGRQLRAFLHQHPLLAVGQEVSEENLDGAVKRVELLSTILNIKKGLPRPTIKEVENKVKETVKKLTTHDSSIAEFLAPYEEQLLVEEQLRRTVREVFAGRRYSMKDRMHPIFPGSGATYSHSRAQAGSVGAILQSDLLEGLRTPGGPMATPITKNEVSDTWNANLTNNYTESTFIREKLEEFEGMRPTKEQIDRIEEVEDGQKHYFYNSSSLEKTYSEFYERLTYAALQEEPNVTPVGLQEPLKVRVITKGPAMTYHVLRPIQKFMHTHMKRQKVFSLIGTPDDEWIIQDTLGAELKDNESYLSGDYEAATDNFRGFVSKTLANEFSKVVGLTTHEQTLLLRSLSGHTFEEGPQQTGQLMGSITSFPFLCLANFALTRYALELSTGKKIPAKIAPILVNGDDVVAKGPEQTFQQVWERVTAVGGLTASIGKTFQSKVFLNINSRTYLRTPRLERVQKTATRTVSRESRFLKTGFVNFGLLTGQSRSIEAGRKCEVGILDPDLNPASRGKKLLEETPAAQLDDTIKLFLKRNRASMEATKLPWFIPEWLGGLGLPSEFGSPSHLDLQIAKRIILNIKKRRPMALYGAKTPWKVRELARNTLSMDTPLYASKTSEPVEALETYTNLASINLLFDSNISLERLYQEVKDNNYLRALHVNRRLWRAPKKGSNPKFSGSLEPELLTGYERHEGLSLTDVNLQSDSQVRVRTPIEGERAASLKIMHDNLIWKKLYGESFQGLLTKVENDQSVSSRRDIITKTSLVAPTLGELRKEWGHPFKTTYVNGVIDPSVQIDIENPNDYEPVWITEQVPVRGKIYIFKNIL